MTNEQAINLLKNLRKSAVMHDGDVVALEMAIKALEQEPCGVSDTNVGKTYAISRQAVIDSLHSKFVDGFDSDRWWNSISVLHVINSAPSVTPKQRTGHCIYTGDYMTDGMLKCSSCGYEHDVADRFLYCPNCGAKMESEEQNNG